MCQRVTEGKGRIAIARSARKRERCIAYRIFRIPYAIFTFPIPYAYVIWCVINRDESFVSYACKYDVSICVLAHVYTYMLQNHHHIHKSIARDILSRRVLSDHCRYHVSICMHTCDVNDRLV